MLTSKQSMSVQTTRPIFAALLMLCGKTTIQAQYQTMRIPQALYGKEFKLTLKDSFRQLRTGNQTITSGINGDFWGPTLFINKGDTVRMDVLNKLNDSTTLHWHGFHLPAVMDGGPHQVIPPNTRWKPYWKVTNQASTYWYHPHLHEMTQEHMTKGLGGLIIVRDSMEATLALPRTYGTDDIPLVLTSRRYDAANQFVYKNSAYGDYLLSNGTPNASFTLPRQMVRLRILNADIERGYNLGFSDNRTFYVIGNDGGLLEAPVSLTRLPVYVGERYEILVDLSGLAEGTTLDLKAYNSGRSNSFPGGEPGTSGVFGSLLNNTDFSVLHIIVGARTSNPILNLPTTLVKQTYLKAGDATNTRTLNVTNGQPANSPFRFDNKLFDIKFINHQVIRNTVEKWSVTNNNVFGHCFHIHDVQFKIVSRSSGPIAAYETGWKDAFFISRNETVAFVARFSDEADPQHPFMYHCHFGNHEDEGMMAQFVVAEPVQGNAEQHTPAKFQAYPNPANDRIYISSEDPSNRIYYVNVVNAAGKTVMMLPQPQAGIEVSNLAPGVYFLHITNQRDKHQSVITFLKR